MIFGKYIKGLNEQTPVGGTTQQLYSFLKFSDAIYDESSDAKFLPEIHINNVNSITGTSVRNLGKIITSDAVNQKIQEDIRIVNNIKLLFGLQDEISNYEMSELYYDAGNSLIEGKNRKQLKIEVFNNNNNSEFATFKTLYNSFIGYINNNDEAILTSDGLTLNGYCQASFFNATSDRRAKINIKPLNLSALELIKRVPICSFTYKDSDLPSIGIIAQDIQDVEIEGFKLVDNEQASGKDYDYMSIHESKLTYILWKAVQEQQEQINLLKEEIEQLKKRG